MWGFQEGPKDQRCSGPGALYPAVTWAPEKYWQPWLTELFFRFEPAPPFDSDPVEQGKHFPACRAQRPRGVGAAVSCSELPSPLPFRGLGVRGEAASAGRRRLAFRGSHPLESLRTWVRLGPQTRASGTKIEKEKWLERICCFQTEREIPKTEKVSLVGRPYTNLTVLPVFI